jgi:hypothetical protein
MTSYFRISIATLICFLMLGGLALAQPQAAASNQPPASSVKLQVVLSRYQGEKKLSSEPYTLLLVPGEGGNIRSGSEMPVPTTTIMGEKGSQTSYTMQSVGTNVDARVTPTADSKYKLSLTVTDRSMFTPPATSPGVDRLANVPAFRSTTSTSNAILSNGETIQFTSVVDKLSNETLKIDVTLTVGNK